jgi:hypothetical protein
MYGQKVRMYFELFLRSGTPSQTTADCNLSEPIDSIVSTKAL